MFNFLENYERLSFMNDINVDRNKLSLPSSIPNTAGVSDTPDHACFWETAFLNNLDTLHFSI